MIEKTTIIRKTRHVRPTATVRRVVTTETMPSTEIIEEVIDPDTVIEEVSTPTVTKVVTRHAHPGDIVIREEDL